MFYRRPLRNISFKISEKLMCDDVFDIILAWTCGFCLRKNSSNGVIVVDSKFWYLAIPDSLLTNRHDLKFYRVEPLLKN
ncbi:hypothetical protein NPIRD3C_0957 [Nitrosopumilus piranensis]|uniref:Uncharacterized protein n=1 Tax=Nitrosopumilus piranensis TaxID=1582439 RepID=A0A0C5BVC0_9ARCH|nr:hypothetical protein NPIRD3C_0957 [Nitrosopumilus piranensis]